MFYSQDILQKRGGKFGIIWYTHFATFELSTVCCLNDVWRRYGPLGYKIACFSYPCAWYLNAPHINIFYRLFGWELKNNPKNGKYKKKKIFGGKSPCENLVSCMRLVYIITDNGLCVFLCKGEKEHAS